MTEAEAKNYALFEAGMWIRSVVHDGLYHDDHDGFDGPDDGPVVRGFLGELAGELLKRALVRPPRRRARRRIRPAVRPPPQGVESGRGSGHEDELGPPVDELFRSWGIG